MKRAANRSFVEARQARRIVAPHLERMPEWQSRVAYLTAAIASRHIDRPGKSLIERRGRELRETIAGALRELESAVESSALPLSSGVARDARQALASALERLDAGLPPPPDSDHGEP